MARRFSFFPFAPIVPVLVILLGTLFAPCAQAGPPLLCWPYDIGDAPSLPMGQEGWRDMKSDYDLKNLVPDTLGLLAPETDVIVRMETLRRAAVYAAQDGGIASTLLSRLRDRVNEAETKGRPDALALFDTGYLIEAYRQAGWVWKVKLFVGRQDGYRMVLRAIELRGGDPRMELAAAMMAADGSADCPADCQRKHVRAALAGATEGSLLARNLARQAAHLHISGTTVAQMTASAGTNQNKH